MGIWVVGQTSTQNVLAIWWVRDRYLDIFLAKDYKSITNLQLVF